MAIKELEARTVPQGSISFIWFNDYAGLVVKTPNYTFVIDPVDVDPNVFKKVDALLVSHEHFDHFNKGIVRKIYENTRCLVIADPTSMRALKGLIPEERLREARIGDAIVVKDAIINVERSYHPPAITPVSFIITSEDRVKVFHTSDSLDFPELRQIGEKYKPDLVFCTIGIAPGASPRTGAKIAKLVRAKLSIPYHGERADDFIRILSQEAPDLKTMIIKKGEIYTYP